MELIENQKDGVFIVEPRGRIDSIGSKTFGDRLAELIRSGYDRATAALDRFRVEVSAAAG